jgi:hypothetical protein
VVHGCRMMQQRICCGNGDGVLGQAHPR